MRLQFSRWFILFTLLGVGHSSPSAAADRPGCAVLTFEARGGVSESQARMLSDRFAVEFERLGHYRLIARSIMREILQDYGQPDLCIATACAVEAGQILSLRYIVYGTIGQLGAVLSVNSFLVDVETGTHIRSATTDVRDGIETLLTRGMRENALQLLGLTVPPAEEAYLDLTVIPAQAKVFIDGEAVRSVGHLVPVQPGYPLQLSATAVGYFSMKQTHTLSAGETKRVELVLTPRAGPHQPPGRIWRPKAH